MIKHSLILLFVFKLTSCKDTPTNFSQEIATAPIAELAGTEGPDRGQCEIVEGFTKKVIKLGTTEIQKLRKKAEALIKEKKGDVLKTGQELKDKAEKFVEGKTKEQLKAEAEAEAQKLIDNKEEIKQEAVDGIKKVGDAVTDKVDQLKDENGELIETAQTFNLVSSSDDKGFFGSFKAAIKSATNFSDYTDSADKLQEGFMQNLKTNPCPLSKADITSEEFIYNESVDLGMYTKEDTPAVIEVEQTGGRCINSRGLRTLVARDANNTTVEIGITQTIALERTKPSERFVEDFKENVAAIKPVVDRAIDNLTSDDVDKEFCQIVETIAERVEDELTRREEDLDFRRDEKKSENNLALESCDKNAPAITKKLSTDAPLSVQFKRICTISKEVKEEDQGNRMVDIVFLLDVSGSMQFNIDTIVEKLDVFVNDIAQFKPRVALVPFVDVVKDEWVVPLSGDTGSFQSTISKIKARGGLGRPEGGLIAMEKALAIFKDGDKAGNSEDAKRIKIVLMITDVVSHFGNEEKDYAIDGVVTSINSYINAGHDFRLYYSVPDIAVYQSEGTEEKLWALPQYNNILAKTNLKLNQNARGSKLSYPFSEGTLLSEFKTKIERAVRNITLECHIKSAQFDSTANTSVALDDLKMSQSLALKTAGISTIVNDTNTLVRDKEWVAKLRRCCGVNADAINACNDTFEQTLPFKVSEQ